MAFRRLSKIERPRRIAPHDGGKVVVEQHQVRRLARDVRAPSAHRDADVRGLQGGRVVDAVSRHRHDLAVRFEGLHQPQFLLGHDPGEKPRAAHTPRQVSVGNRFEVGAGQQVFRGKPDLASNGRCGRGIVARDHGDANSGFVAATDRVGSAGSDRVGESKQTEPFEPEAPRPVRKRALAGPGFRDAKNAEPLGGERPDLARQGLLPRRVETAEARDRLGRTLGGHDERSSALRLPDARDREEAGGQRIFAPESPAVHGGAFPERVAREVLDRELHRVERRGLPGQAGVRQELGKWRGKLTRRLAGDVEGALAGHQTCDGHPVLREGARLVHAKNRRRAERLDRRDAARQDLLARKAPGAEGQKDCQHHGKFLGDERHRQRQTGEQAAEQGSAGRGRDSSDEQAEHQTDQGDDPDEARWVLLLEERVSRRVAVPEHLSDPAHRGCRAGLERPRHAGASRHRAFRRTRTAGRLRRAGPCAPAPARKASLAHREQTRP